MYCSRTLPLAVLGELYQFFNFVDLESSCSCHSLIDMPRALLLQSLQSRTLNYFSSNLFVSLYTLYLFTTESRYRLDDHIDLLPSIWHASTVI